MVLAPLAARTTAAQLKRNQNVMNSMVSCLGPYLPTWALFLILQCGEQRGLTALMMAVGKGGTLHAYLNLLTVVHDFKMGFLVRKVTCVVGAVCVWVCVSRC